MVLANPCDSSPCKNGGTCENKGDTLTCNCTAMFYGKTCELRKAPGVQGPMCKGPNCEGKGSNPCDSSPCKNGGNCESKGDTFTCNCAAMFYGKTCEIRKAQGVQGPACKSPNREEKGLQLDISI